MECTATNVCEHSEADDIYDTADKQQVLWLRAVNTCNMNSTYNKFTPADGECLSEDNNTLCFMLQGSKHSSVDRVSNVDKVMIWTEYDAYVLQVKQIGVSACGPTAVINVLVCSHYVVITYNYIVSWNQWSALNYIVTINYFS